MTNTIRRILVAVDLSDPRGAAFERALLLARGWNAELYLLHMRPPQPAARLAITGESLELERRESGRSHMKALARSANDQGVQVQIISAHGDPARAIAAHAHLVMADLVVVERDFGSSRMWRTPRVAAAVSRSAPVPVLIVPSRKTTPHSPVTPFKEMVVAVDFTVTSAVALRVATDVIAQGDARGTVVHALSYGSPMVFSSSEAASVMRGQLAQAETRLRGAIPAGAGYRVTSRVVAGAAAQAILDVAADVDADLVVMGVSRRNRFDELFFGSTFRRVVRRSLRPILAVPVGAGAYRWAGAPPAHGISERYRRAA